VGAREVYSVSFIVLPFSHTDFHTQNQSSDVDSSAYNQNEAHLHSHHQDLPYVQQNGAGDVDDEEDYSISVSAIMQRRASVRGYRGQRGSRNSRRASSPMDHVLDSVERRRSSVYTTSSGKYLKCLTKISFNLPRPQVANQCKKSQTVVVISVVTCLHLLARGQRGECVMLNV